MRPNATSVLVVDDDKLVLALCKLSFEEHGYRVLLAENADAALRHLGVVRVDVVLLDILMPEKDGLATLLEIRERFPGITVLAMCESGRHSKYDFRIAAKKFGATGVIQKPFAPRDLIRIIDALPNCTTKADSVTVPVFAQPAS